MTENRSDEKTPMPGAVVEIVDPSHGSDTSLDIECITQSPREPAPQRYRDICRGTADLLSTSRHCEGTGCGGHPICRPCYDLAHAEGLAL